MTAENKPAANGERAIDWAAIARKAIRGLMWAGAVAGGVYVLAQAVEEAVSEELKDVTEPTPAAGAPSPDPAAEDDGPADADREAAELLGVPLDASADEIRAALRAKLVRSRLHPDQGGDGDEAKRLIAAKNLLIERLNQERQS
jgi:hypothetical protein